MKIIKKHRLLIDTREQRPLDFYNFNVKVKLCKLSYGDYTMKFLDGSISSTLFERKSISDLFGTLGKHHNRFKQEIERAKKDNAVFIIIVEGTLTKVFKGFKHSKILGISIVRIIFTLWLKYGIITVFAKDRQEASNFILEYFAAEWRKKLEAKK